MPTIKGNAQISRLKLGTMTTAERLSLTGMVNGASVYDTDMGGEYIWDGSAWFRFLKQPFDYINGDPTTYTVGDIWYNSVANVFKGVSVGGGGAGTWIAASSLLTPRDQLGGVGDTTLAVLSFGGGIGVLNTATTELYNSVVWSVVGSLLVSRRNLSGTGTSNAALSFGGFLNASFGTGAAEAYDGTTWSTIPPITPRFTLGGVGTNTDALAIGGFSSVIINNVDIYNGTSWTPITPIPVATGGIGAVGSSSSAALVFGGLTAANIEVQTVWTYNGSTWSSGNPTISQPRRELSGSGTATAALSFGGFSNGFGVFNTTESFDGLIWTARNGLLTARRFLAGAGTSAKSLSFGGVGTASNNTEAFIVLSIKTFTVV